MTEQTASLSESRAVTETSRQSSTDAQARERRLFAVMMVLSLLILMIGMIWTWRLGQAANKIHHNLGHSQDDLRVLQEYVRRSKGQ
jgi:hypothetical protein